VGALLPLSEYSEYRVGAYHPFGRPTAPQGTTRGAQPAVLTVALGTQGVPLRMLYSGGSPPSQAPEVHSRKAYLPIENTLNGALTRHGLRGSLGNRWGPTAVRGTPGTHAAGGGLRPSEVLRVLTQSGLDLRR
jgi:hypothetical protein